jgi:RNA polymerase sigma factor for flagellar operon FliA
MSMLQQVARAPRAFDHVEDAGLWSAWRDHGDHTARERLIERYLEFAKMFAAKCYAGRFSDEFEFGDYMQFATIGLIESVDRYDPALAASFKTYSAQRIRGAVLDGIARMSEQLQQITARQRLLAERSTYSSQGELSGPDTVLEQLASVAIGFALGFMLEDSGMYEADEKSVPDNCYTRIEMRQLREKLLGLVGKLPERERMVIQHHYLHQLPFETIANILSLSKGRVSQLHRSALEALRKAAAQTRRVDLTW